MDKAKVLKEIRDEWLSAIVDQVEDGIETTLTIDDAGKLYRDQYGKGRGVRILTANETYYQRHKGEGAMADVIMSDIGQYLDMLVG